MRHLYTTRELPLSSITGTAGRWLATELKMKRKGNRMGDRMWIQKREKGCLNQGLDLEYGISTGHVIIDR